MCKACSYLPTTYLLATACFLPFRLCLFISACQTGAEHNCYTADITRTFPACGFFTPQQRDIYNLVLDMQLHALSALKPGVSWATIQRLTRLLMLQHLQQLQLVASGSVEGLLEAGVDKLFMPHGLGHFLGLDVHDVSDVGPVPQQLQEGQVITVEPGRDQSWKARLCIWSEACGLNPCTKMAHLVTCILYQEGVI